MDGPGVSMETKRTGGECMLCQLCCCNVKGAQCSLPVSTPWDKNGAREDIYARRFFFFTFLGGGAAKLRSDVSRLARKTWSASKKAARLEDHLSIYIACNNGYDIA